MISQKDVAQAAGVERSTVSLALRGHPNVARETRERVRRIARELGYQPHPLLGELAGRRWRQGGRGLREMVAFIPTRARDDHPILRAARSRLTELGYGMAVVEPGTYPNDRALSRVLYNRGIRGLLLEQITEEDRERALDWDKFCVVQCGLLRRTIRAHRVSVDLVEMVREAVGRLVARGRRRVGFFLPTNAAYHSDELLLQAAVGAASLPAWRDRVTGVARCEPTAKAMRAAAAGLRGADWDAVIAPSWREADVLRSAGVLRPGVAFVALIGEEGGGEATGFAPHNETVGRLGAELMDRLLRAHARGLPTVPQWVTFVPEWRERTER